MVVVKYDFPLPNHGEDYLLTEKELVQLLDKAYQNGYDAGYAMTDFETTSAVSNTFIEPKIYSFQELIRDEGLKKMKVML